MDKIEFYKQTSQYTDIGRYKKDVTLLWEQKCNKSLKQLCLYLMNVTLHRVILQLSMKDNNLSEYGDFSYVDYTTPLSEDDIFLTANAMLGEIYRRDEKGFYLGRPANTRINVTCRYVSILTSAILKANNIPCRSRVGWARYLGKYIQNHWINEYYSDKEKRWIMFDLDDLYDQEFTKLEMYRKNKIAYEYLDIRENQFYTSAQAWLEYRKNYNFIESFRVLNRKVDSKMLIANLFLDFYAIMNLEHHYYTLPIAFDKEKYIEKDLKEADTIAKLLLEPNKNFEKLQQIFHDTPKYRMLTSPLVVKEDYSQLIVAKNYKID
ncbi:MAG: transglutaminase domain-containing protein [Clostridia bacterium]|nr:transglutaminase domain-containing protein [Clostridia bacterium]